VRNVRYGSIADMCSALAHVCFAPIADIAIVTYAKQMRWPVKIFAVVCWVLVASTLALWHEWGWGVVLVFAGLCIIPSLAWARYSHNIQMLQLLRAGQPPDKPLPLQPDKVSLALSIHPVVLWLLALGSLAFVATGIFILIVDPGRWLIALASIGFFGLCATFAAHLLVLRRSAAAARS
jgi:hypothetical protein